MDLHLPFVTLFVPVAFGCAPEPRGAVLAPNATPSALTVTSALEDEPSSAPSTTVELRDCPAPLELGVRFVGRTDGCEPSGVRIGWSGAGFLGRFSGTGIQMRHRGPAVQYTVLVDGRPVEKVITKPGTEAYSLAVGLASGEHSFEVYRRGEASFGAAVIHGFDVADGRLLSSPEPRERRLEIVGDSISCGYGNEGMSKDCPFSADTENHYRAYGAVLGRLYDADVSTVAWSGRGVVVNYNGEPGPTMPELYESAVPTDAPSRWGFAWAPQVVVVNLGTNDYSTNVDPSDAEFISKYEALLGAIRAHAPEAFILCTVGPMLGGADLTTARSTIRAAVARRNEAGDGRVAAHELETANDNPGCDWHPSVATHEAMARELGQVIAPMVGWAVRQ